MSTHVLKVGWEGKSRAFGLFMGWGARARVGPDPLELLLGSKFGPINKFWARLGLSDRKLQAYISHAYILVLVKYEFAQK